MKIIDEKGRLFGKINLIDLLIVLVVALVAVAFVWKITGSRAPGDVAQHDHLINAGDEVTVRYEVIVAGIDEAYFKGLERYAEGASLVRDNNVINGKIVKFEKAACETALDPNGNVIAVEGQDRYDAIFTIEYTGKMNTNALVEGQQVIRVGAQYTVRTLFIDIIGYITDVEIIGK